MYEFVTVFGIADGLCAHLVSGVVPSKAYVGHLTATLLCSGEPSHGADPPLLEA